MPCPRNSSRGRIIGRSNALQRVISEVELIAPTRLPVLLRGETGTGKELFAECLHASGNRIGRWVPVNCAAFPADLLESELFGHVEGAFTGAVRDRTGLVEAAAGGTIFLDEIGEMSSFVQAKLLRVMQSGEVRPVGSNDIKHVDVRVVAATNRPMKAEVMAERFRTDLLGRFAYCVTLPPLRERLEDIELLIDHFLERIRRRYPATAPAVSDEALQLMRDYCWPGNVRELHFAVESAAVFAAYSGTILPEHLPEKVGRVGARTWHAADTRTLFHDEPDGLKPLDAVINAYVALVMRTVDGNKTQAARILGIDRTTVARRLSRQTD